MIEYVIDGAMTVALLVIISIVTYALLGGVAMFLGVYNPPKEKAVTDCGREIQTYTNRYAACFFGQVIGLVAAITIGVLFVLGAIGLIVNALGLL